ncbi:MAG: asparaginase [Rubrivivax sp.]
MNATTNPVLVDVLRGDHVESCHRGALAVLDASGAVRLALGDIERPIFPRSAVKLLQALPLVAAGAADAIGLDDTMLALACASHNGEAAHVETAAQMLTRVGLDDAVLACGAQPPRTDAALQALRRAGAAPGALHNNCSGKHAGFACLGCALSGGLRGPALAAWLDGYERPGHPLMREVDAALQAATGWDLSRSAVGTDGCSIPAHAIPLRHLALAFARVATGQGLSAEHALAAARLRGAVAAAPFMVGGSARFDTQVMQRLGARVCCKVGAEGVYCAALPELGLGIAIKIDDGNTARAAEVALAALLQHLLVLDGDDARLLAGLADVTLHNWRGLTVGRLIAAEALRAATG